MQANKESLEFGIEFVKDVAESYGIGSISEATADTIATHLNFVIKLLLNGAKSNRIACGRMNFDIQDLQIAAQDLRINIPTTSWNAHQHRTGLINPNQHLANSYMNNKIFGDIKLQPHWLIIDGKEPIYEENPLPTFNELEIKSDRIKKEPQELFEESWKAKPKVEACIVRTKAVHQVSLELQKLFIEIMEMLVSGDGVRLNRAMFVLRSDPSIQILVPRIISFVVNSIKANIANEFLHVIEYLLLAIESLLANSYLDIQDELHVLLPAVISCIIIRSPTFDKEGSYGMRRLAAKVLVKIFKKHDLPNAQHRALNVFSNAFNNSQTSIPALVTAIFSFKSMGPEAVELYLFKHLPRIKQLIGNYKPKKEIIEKENSRKQDSTKLGDMIFETLMDYCRSSLMSERNLENCRKLFGPFGDDIFKRMKAENLLDNNTAKTKNK